MQSKLLCLDGKPISNQLQNRIQGVGWAGRGSQVLSGRPLFGALAVWTRQGDPFLPTPFVTGGHRDSAWAKAELHTCSCPQMPGGKSPQAVTHSGFSSEGQAPAWAGRWNAVFIAGGASPHEAPVRGHLIPNLAGHLPFLAVLIRAEPGLGLKVTDPARCLVPSRCLILQGV